MAEIYELAKPFGRPRKFKTAGDLWTAFLDYAKWCESNPIKLVQSKKQSQGTRGDYKEASNDVVARPFTITAFRLHAGIKRDWCTFKRDYEDRSQDFCRVLISIEESVRSQQVENALVGNYKENLVARLNGIQDSVRQEVTAQVSGNKELSVQEAQEFINKLNEEV